MLQCTQRIAAMAPLRQYCNNTVLQQYCGNAAAIAVLQQHCGNAHCKVLLQYCGNRGHCGNAFWYCRNTPIFSRCNEMRFLGSLNLTPDHHPQSKGCSGSTSFLNSAPRARTTDITLSTGPLLLGLSLCISPLATPGPRLTLFSQEPRWGTVAHLQLHPVDSLLALGLPRFAPTPLLAGSCLLNKLIEVAKLFLNLWKLGIL